MTTWVIVLACAPLAGTVAGVFRARSRQAGIAAVAGGVVALAIAVLLLAWTVSHGPVRGLSGFVYLDSLGAFFVFTVALVVLLASRGLTGTDHVDGREPRQ